METQKVMIGVPTRGHPHFANREFNSMAAAKGYITIYQPCTLSVEDARGRLTLKFMKEEHFTHLFFLDDDVMCPDGTIERLLKHDVDVASANYPLYINGRIHSCGYDWGTDEKKKVKPYEIHTRGFREVGAIGLGACLIKRHVLSKVFKYPCYRMLYSLNYEMIQTDDITFSKFVKNAGFKIYVDFDIQCDHFKSVSLNTIGNELGWGKQKDCVTVTSVDLPSKKKTSLETAAY